MIKFRSFLLLSVLLSPLSTFAHSDVELQKSIPADNAMLMSAPKALLLNFSDDVRLTAISLTSEKGESIDFSFAPAFKKSASYQWKLPQLPPSTYTVSYVLMSDDGHKIAQDYTFMVH